jgi:putative nucleotidyltransferase with HDIG domain
MISDTAVLKKLAKIKEIATLSEVIHEVLTALASDESSAQDLAVILSKDQALCAKVLKIANSAFFAQSRRILDIDSAIVLLGFDSIAQLALATSVFNAFGTGRTHARFDIYGFWEHSIATAIGAKDIAETLHRNADRKVAYTAGLLHDIGKLVLLIHFPEEYGPVLHQLDSEGMFLHGAEQSILGFTHCDVGEWLFNRWNYPERLVQAVARHHNTLLPEPEPDFVVGAVRLADLLSNRMHIGASGNTLVPPLEPNECLIIGLDETKLVEVEQKLESAARGITRVLQAMTERR